MIKKHNVTNFDDILDEFVKPKKVRPIHANVNESQFVKRYACSDHTCAATFVSEKSLRCHMRQHVTLHPPPAPTVEIIISAAASEEADAQEQNSVDPLQTVESTDQSLTSISHSAVELEEVEGGDGNTIFIICSEDEIGSTAQQPVSVITFAETSCAEPSSSSTVYLQSDN